MALLFTDNSSPIWYGIVVSPKVYDDKKSVVSIFRPATSTKDAEILPSSQMTYLWIDSPSQTTRKILCSNADTMGIYKRYKQRLRRGTFPINISKKKKDKETITKPHSKEDDLRKRATKTSEDTNNKDVDAKTGDINPQDTQSESDDLSDIEDTYLKANMKIYIPLETAAIFFLASLFLIQGIGKVYIMADFICIG